MTIALAFAAAAVVIVFAGTRLARYGDVLGEKSGLGGHWIGTILLAATTSLPELFTGVGAIVVNPLPDIAAGDIFGSCMFNLLILSLLDAVQPEPISARAHQGHALSIGFGLVVTGIAGLGLLAAPTLPAIGWVGLTTPVLVVTYGIAMRLVFTQEQRRLARDAQEVAARLKYEEVATRTAVLRYALAAMAVVIAALFLPRLGAALADSTGLGRAFVGSLFIAITTSLPEVVVSLAAVRLGAVDLGIANLLGSNLFNLLILAVDDVMYLEGPLLADVGPVHLVSVLAVVVMNALFLVGLTYRALTKRFVVSWDTGTMAAVYAAAVWLSYLLMR